jgi:polyisoprenoid-binding protein YceI
MKFHISILCILFILVPFLVQSQSYHTRSAHAEFHSSVPLHEFTGESDYLTGMIDFDENLVDFYLDLSTLKTGNARRDRDMYRTLNIDDYPFAEFTGTLESSFDQNSTEKQVVTVTGEFTLHGVTAEKTIEGSLQRQGDAILLEAEWVQDITDHNIEPPGILFYRVRDEMDIRISAVLEQEEDDS